VPSIVLNEMVEEALSYEFNWKINWKCISWYV
jgi:hypothetical protein